jgi:hypothetical protein
LPENVVQDRKAASALMKPYFDPILKDVCPFLQAVV